MRKPGRRPLDEHDESVPVHLTMTLTDYAATAKRAQEAHVSVAEIIRRDVRAGMEKEQRRE